MIRTNLATRPFYNERAVRLTLVVLGILALAATVFNVTRVIQLSRRDTQLVMQSARDEARAADLGTSAALLRGTIDTRALERASADARQANELIDRRTFSWTELFNRLETTLPDDVRITAIQPRLDPKRGIVLTLMVLAKGVDDVNQFMENLETTGAFADLIAHENHFDEQGQLAAALDTSYRPVATPSNTRGAER
jgi:type IV pilus assembly protein PilN